MTHNKLECFIATFEYLSGYCHTYHTPPQLLEKISCSQKHISR